MPLDLIVGMIAGLGAMALWAAVLVRRDSSRWPFLAGWFATFVAVPVLLLGAVWS